MTASLILLLIAASLLQGLYVYGTCVADYWGEFPILQQTEGRMRTLRIRGLMYACAAAIPLVGVIIASMLVLDTGCNRHGWKL